MLAGVPLVVWSLSCGATTGRGQVPTVQPRGPWMWRRGGPLLWWPHPRRSDGEHTTEFTHQDKCLAHPCRQDQGAGRVRVLTLITPLGSWLRRVPGVQTATRTLILFHLNLLIHQVGSVTILRVLGGASRGVHLGLLHTGAGPGPRSAFHGVSCDNSRPPYPWGHIPGPPAGS